MGIELVGEFIGTVLLVLLGDGVIAGMVLKDSKGNGNNWTTISLGWGLAITIAAYASSYMAPGNLNPAVTVAMAITGNLPINEMIPFIVVQLLGAMVGALLLYVHYHEFWDDQMASDVTLSIFSTVPARKANIYNLFNEMLGTFILVFVILALTKIENFGMFVPLVAGLAVASLVYSLGGTTGAALNPARDLGPRIIYSLLPFSKKEAQWNYAWVPVFGPFIGAILAALLFNITK